MGLRHVQLWGLALAAVLLQGCIAIPHPETPMQLRPGVSGKRDYAFIKPGTTTRQEVMLTLGEPDLRWRDDRVFVYHWIGTELFVVIFGYPQSAEIDVPKQHFLLIAFDQQGIASRVEEKQDAAFNWVSAEKLRKEWGPKEDSP